MSTAKPTEAHVNAIRQISQLLAVRADNEAAQLIADSEAQAVANKVAEIIEKNAPEIVKTNAELAAEREKVRVLREALEKFRHTVVAGGTKPAQSALAVTEEASK